MIPRFASHILQSPRKTLAAASLSCVAMLAFGLYLQYGVGLEPCPMCVVQRYALILLAITAAIGAMCRATWGQLIAETASLAAIGLGIFTAARQSLLQWNPPAEATCGRGFDAMVTDFPLSRAIPMIFRGGGDCASVDWTFLGGSIANWSFLCFLGLALAVLWATRATHLTGRR